MEIICGNCRYFKKSSISNAGICMNKHSKVRTKTSRTYLSKGCNAFDMSENEEHCDLYTAKDDIVIRELLFWLRVESNKLNDKRRIAIKHLLNDYNKLKGRGRNIK